MTPLAHRIAKELTLPKRARSFDDGASIIARMSSIHCFEVTAILPLVRELSESMFDLAKKVDQIPQAEKFFLPATKTWIEWQADGRRKAVLLEAQHDSLSAECRWSFLDRDGFACSVPGLGHLELSCVNHIDLKTTPIRSAAPEAIRSNAEGERGLIFDLWAMLAIINTPRIIGRRQHMPHRGLEKRLTAALKPIGKFPLHAWTEILLRVTPPKDASDGLSTEAHLTGERALHFCRAHLRVRLGRLEVVRAHWRGDGALGIKQSRYRVAA